MKKLFLFSAIILAMSFQSCESWTGCGVISDKKPIQEGYMVKYYLILTDDRGNEHKVEVTKKEYNERMEGEIICQNP